MSHPTVCCAHQPDVPSNFSEIQLVVGILQTLKLHVLTISLELQEMDRSEFPKADRQPWKLWVSEDSNIQDDVVKSCLGWKPNPNNPHSKPWQGRDGWMAKYSEMVESKAGYIKSGNGQG